MSEPITTRRRAAIWRSAQRLFLAALMTMLAACADEVSSNPVDAGSGGGAGGGAGGSTGSAGSAGSTGSTLDAGPDAASPTCTDGQKNGDETDVDCGGACGACADGKGCDIAADCQSGACVAGTCQTPVPTCTDAQQNGDETDVDCGGSCPACIDGNDCNAGSDCASGVCSMGGCQAPACDDGVKNASETDVDCGGTCAGCGYGKACSIDADCATGACVVGACEHAVTALAAGGFHACVILGTGALKCWGLNSNGELGLGDMQSRGDGAGEMGKNLPAIDLGAGHHAVSVSAGVRHTCAIREDGVLKCWGINSAGQLGLGDMANRGDGPGEMGDNLPAVDLGAGHTAKAVFAGDTHTCAIRDDGALKCWGGNTDGQLGIGSTQARGDGPGEMGDNLPTVDLGTGRLAVSLSLGGATTCALLDDATVKCWGHNGGGTAGQGNGSSIGTIAGQMGDSLPPIALGTGRTAKALRAGFSHACALLDDGNIKCWGYNLDGRLGLGDLVNRGDTQGEMGDALPAVNLGTGRTAVALSGGANSMCAVLDDATLKCWGLNQGGVLGLGDTATRGATPASMGDNLPVTQLGTGRTVRLMAGTWFSMCAALDDESVKCWGSNNTGQLGLGDSNARGDGPGEMGDALPKVSIP